MNSFQPYQMQLVRVKLRELARISLTACSKKIFVTFCYSCSLFKNVQTQIKETNLKDCFAAHFMSVFISMMCLVYVKAAVFTCLLKPQRKIFVIL